MDPFRHLPRLRDRLTPPDQSEVRLTPDVLAVWDERARAQGRDAGWRMSDQQREANRRSVLGGFAAGQDLWVYSYGSLMWDPALHFAEVRLAGLNDYQRRFTFKTHLGRGTMERPALMLSLERQPGNCCTGLAFRIGANLAEAESEILWRREMIRGSYCPMLLPVDTPQGRVTAVVFASNQSHADYVGELPLAETAEIIANATGVIGSNCHYLEQLVAQLETLAIEDAYIESLMRQVRDLQKTG